MTRPRALFVTGTDTGVGKTLVAAALLRALRERGARVAGMKPVASGCRETPDGIVSDDALALIAEASVAAPYGIVNPYAFLPAIAPHLAALDAGTRIDLSEVERAFHRLAGLADVVVIEGAGGWLTPLDERHTLADFAARVRARVILVVGLRLGCLNHALLTAQAIDRAGLRLAAWVANAIQPDFERAADNVRALSERLSAPLLGHISHQSHAIAASVARELRLDVLDLSDGSVKVT